jgi:hypothetical protein
MNVLRNWWRRGPVYQYFADLDAIDRATALIVLTLLLAWGLTFAAIVRAREPAETSQPLLTAPPFIMEFVVAASAVPA